MVNKTLLDVVTDNPISAPLTGGEPFETVVDAVGAGGLLRQLSFVPVNSNSGTGYTLVLEDQGRLVSMTNAADNTVTVPPDAVLIPIGATILIEQNNVGKTTIAPGSGVTISNKSSVIPAISERYGRAVLHKVAADSWHLTGELELA